MMMMMMMNKQYLKGLIEKTEEFICRMRWLLYFFNRREQEHLNKYGFKSRKNPPPINEIEPFERDLFELVREIKFQNVSNPIKKNYERQTRTKFLSNQIKQKIYMQLTKTLTIGSYQIASQTHIKK
uniref:Uncharacterized protein n=1 Tax=Octopus bimaculoides TaxID=37653 RepID=A0A0L8H3F2_OCTBM